MGIIIPLENHGFLVFAKNKKLKQKHVNVLYKPYYKYIETKALPMQHVFTSKKILLCLSTVVYSSYKIILGRNLPKYLAVTSISETHTHRGKSGHICRSHL